jgi:hypothetical protein
LPAAASSADGSRLQAESASASTQRIGGSGQTPRLPLLRGAFRDCELGFFLWHRATIIRRFESSTLWTCRKICCLVALARICAGAAEPRLSHCVKAGDCSMREPRISVAVSPQHGWVL